MVFARTRSTLNSEVTMREVLFELNGWEIIRTESSFSDVIEKVYVCHTECDSFGYHSVIGIGSCLICEKKMPDEIVALWCLQEPDLL